MRSVGLLFVLACAALGQSGIETFALNTVGPGTEYRVHGNAPLVKDAPFSAEQRSAAGVAKIARDRNGRTRLEREKTPGLVEINDPAAGAFFLIESERGVAHRVKYDPPPPPRPAPLEPLNPLGATGGFVQPIVVEAPKLAEKSEALGEREVSGVLAEGTRTTVTSPDGTEITFEVWLARSIDATVLSIARHPQVGEVRTGLTNVVAGEPDPELFRIPAAVMVVDEAPLFRVDTRR